MTTTSGAGAHVAAHGRHFARHDGTRLVYAVHGHVPYDDTNHLSELYRIHHVDPAIRNLFANRFLPLCSLHEKSGLRTAQLAGLLKFPRRATLAGTPVPRSTVLEQVRTAVRAGDARWVMDVRVLPHLFPPTPTVPSRTDG
ncbi:hypothetical protein [Embleya hyalina]|uniref:Uncharacterized protein n=1 Tax=Embleya hyalina TaxID=516124 RepID=A0A401Z5T7_9ACTN|nr:hypothetical protein [Embleya hyalina]GCE02207.1 hypothetical protein EHYA_09984 [Embleya hyalina]